MGLHGQDVDLENGPKPSNVQANINEQLRWAGDQVLLSRRHAMLRYPPRLLHALASAEFQPIKEGDIAIVVVNRQEQVLDPIKLFPENQKLAAILDIAFQYNSCEFLSQITDLNTAGDSNQ
ncbi:MAG: hypothetical protein M2R45_03684 [Verrucomicrobia subdivision 3 bacterium]|nr:hypothetical protein [Limisphaerales bacterium]MCS1414967.1 hypothetical protein [Limisphaerales bacterium]